VEPELAANRVTKNADTAIYLYCVLRAPRRPRLSGVPKGVPGAAAPEIHSVSGSLLVVVSRVPLDVYAPDRLEPKLRDLDWVSEAAVAHEAINEHFARLRSTVVIPMKLFTMFSSIDKAVADIMSRRKSIDETVRRISGCEEWGIRVTRRPAIVTSADEASRPRTGAGFLQARKAARDEAANARREAANAADLAFAALGHLAKDAYRRPRTQEPGTNPPLLEAAFLVRVAARARFKAAARRQAAALGNASAELSLTGPWPAYNFVGPERAS
jgi:hypothetical protein